MDLSHIISQCLSAKRGNREFALFGFEDEWLAEIGNRSSHVGLGEIDGEFRGTGKTAEEACMSLLRALGETVSNEPVQ